MKDSIHIHVKNGSGETQAIEIPTGVNLSLMEVLKAADYDIAATCGGMALCATCHVQILNGLDRLPAPGNAELDMLDTLPVLTSSSRLACQIKIETDLDGIEVKIVG
jgi:ferredoxin